MSHALEVLEFGRVLEDIASRAVSEAGAARVRRLAPLEERRAAERELDAVEELREARAGPEGWRLGDFPPLETPLARLRVEGGRLEAPDILACASVMGAARAARALGGGVADDGPIARTLDRLWGDEALEKRIAGTFDDAGAVVDGASRELRRIRTSLASRRSDLVGRLERLAAGLSERLRVPDASVTVRNGRYCIPVRREGKSSVGGLVHDASASRQTLFIEPGVAIEAMNEIRELELAEDREVDRILRELSAALREGRAELQGAYEALGRLDDWSARADFAAELEGARPAFLEPDEGAIRIRTGQHPLLALGEGAVPFDLDLAADERVLLISGPNAGGKTVLLKSIGLLAALARSGVVPPAGPGTRIPFFRRIFAVIGDEQSIDASLSTFGAQARNLAEILTGAGPDDLVLIDEIGSATDPAEGGALAAAALERLAGQARLTVATTHLGDLKRLGDEDRRTVNASLQFDARKLEPTFRLIRDRPGRSYALVIAARLGVPDDVLEAARARLDADHVAMDDLLGRLETERAEAEAVRASLATRVGELEGRETELEAREAELEAREREATLAAERERHRLLREAREEIEGTIRALEDRYAGASETERAEARRAARSAIEREFRAAGEAVAGARVERETIDPERAPAPGEAVRWTASGQTGVLAEVRGDRGIVEVEGLRLAVPLVELEADPSPGEAGRGDRRRDAPEGPAERRPELEVRTEVDLRGLRVEEVEGALQPALDAAFVAEIPSLRIIHGKGTGALREAVRALLDADPRAPAFRPGGVGEGGAGVTVVEIR